MILTPRSVFLHIPKTGGMWVASALRATGTPVFQGPHHIPAGLVLPSVPDRYSFTVVRHPVTWWRSYWAHSCTYGWPAVEQPFHRIKNNTLWPTYAQFMTKILTDIPGEYSLIVDRFTDGVEHVGRMEHLESDLRDILYAAGEPALPAGLARVNTGSYPDSAATTAEIDAEILRTEAAVVAEYYGESQ